MREEAVKAAMVGGSVSDSRSAIRLALLVFICCLTFGFGLDALARTGPCLGNGVGFIYSAVVWPFPSGRGTNSFPTKI